MATRRRLAILSSHIRLTAPPPCSSGVSASFCASDKQRLSLSKESSQENDCVFCKIIRGESPALKLYEDDTCLCILDTNPLSRGNKQISEDTIMDPQFLVVQAETYVASDRRVHQKSELEETTSRTKNTRQWSPPSINWFKVVAAMCSKVPLISNAIMKATGAVLDKESSSTSSLTYSIEHLNEADSFNLLVNSGAAAGQVIFHTHIHIIPRKARDCLWTSESLRRRPLKIDEETYQLADQVREKLSNICEDSKGQESSLA